MDWWFLSVNVPGTLNLQRTSPGLSTLMAHHKGYHADMAQMAAQMFCKHKVSGSSPLVGSKELDLQNPSHLPMQINMGIFVTVFQ